MIKAANLIAYSEFEHRSKSASIDYVYDEDTVQLTIGEHKYVFNGKGELQTAKIMEVDVNFGSTCHVYPSQNASCGGDRPRPETVYIPTHYKTED